MSDWNDRIIAEFRDNGGVVGGPFAGSFLLLLTTIGARTARHRTVPLAYTDDVDSGTRILVASKTGSPYRPGWYHNVVADPRVHVEAATAAGIDDYDAIASELRGSQRAQRYADIMASRPAFAAFQQESHRELPLVVLTRATV